MNTKSSLALAVVFAFTSVSAHADNFLWIGPNSGGTYSDGANWLHQTGTSTRTSPNDAADRAIFAPGEGVELSIAGGGIGARYVVVSNGVVVLTESTEHSLRSSAEVTVFEGAELRIVGSTTAYNGGKTLTKKGAGTLSVAQLGYSATTRCFGPVTVEAGTFVISGKSYAPAFTVKAGAQLVLDGSGTLNSTTPAVVTLEEGAVFHHAGTGNIVFAGVAGAGTIQGGGTGSLRFNLAGDPLTFSGTTVGFPRIMFTNSTQLAAADFTYAVSNPRAFENAVIADSGAIRFASGIEDVYIGRLVGDFAGKWTTSLVTANADGDPITVHTLVDVGQYAGGVRLTDGVWCGGITNSAATGQLTVSGSNTLDDISMTLNRTIAFEAGSILVQDGGVACAGMEANTANGVTQQLLPTGVKFDDPTMSGTFRVVDGGEAWVKGYAGELPKRLEVLDATLTMIRGDWYGKYATEQEPCEVVLDNATLRLSGRSGASTGSALTMNVFKKDGANAKLEIGSRGATFASVESWYNGEGQDNVGYTKSYVQFHHPFLGVDGNPRGPLTFFGWTNWRYWKAFGSGGTVSFLDGIHTAMDATEIEAAGGAFFGDGDIRIRGAMVGFETGVASSVPLRLATGTGRTLIYEDNAGIQLCPSGDSVAKNLELGALERAGAGSALFICNSASTIGKDGGSSVKLAAAPAVNADGIVLDPIYQSHDSNEAVMPFKYDETKGLVSMTTSDFVEGLNEGKYSKVTSTIYPSGTPSVAGLYVTAKIGLIPTAVLTVGDGVHPAYVAFNTVATAFERGTLAFGGSEGVIISPGSYGNAGNNIGCKITGSNGLSIFGPPEDLRPAYVNLNAANAYTGGTRISGAIVGANHENCFAEGSVYVNGGDYAGGTVWFKTAGTWANDFHVRGFGRRKEKYNNDPFGALVFWDAVTLTGDVELVGPTKMSVWTDVDSRISGTVSGDKLSLYSFKANKGGVLELAGHNTYTGGTEVIQQSVAIREADGFGTGPVRMEKGVLIFRNPSAITVPNAMSGHDVTLRYEGAGAATLANAAELGVTRVEVTPGTHAFAALPAARPIISTAETPRQRTILVLKAGGTYALTQTDLEGYFEIVLENGATLDLGGEELTIYRFTGDKTNVNGTIVETNPKQGTVMFLW